MGEHTKIPWADHTFSAWRGCTKISSGCTHCYAEGMAKRFPEVHGVWGDSGTRIVTKSWRDPRNWNAKAEHTGARVFTASMSDVFEDRPELAEHRDRLFRLIEETKNLTWLVLTKRPENIERLYGTTFPDNVWLGVTAENQEMWDLRVMALAKFDATHRFVSMEPMLEPIDMYLTGTFPKTAGLGYCDLSMRVDQIIVGAESGPRRRPFELDWARSIRDQCAEVGVKFFFKQIIGEDGRKIETPELDGVVHVAFPDTAE